MSMRRLAGTIVLIGILNFGCEMFEKSEDADPEPKAVQEAAVPPPPPRDGLIPVGQEAPDFEALDQEGERVELSELLELQDVVLIFYPADFTPGCTRQLCAVRDEWTEFRRRGATVLGVNPANVERHADFAEEYRFPFPVLSDRGGLIAAGYGAQGNNPNQPQRTVYVIRRDGRVWLAERGMVGHDKIFAALDRP